ncbi:hypothetical protein NLG97_g1189 [Lecanicillium saksenae]|uniref:Uncharacterized protein n=1 Tax=Lecanicillium saksenae TaxID=468837 RepID=A0ACC1R7V6_9HYPO|nr:hypothetical protein NLG97_g1189 [Lecanicillium saksenae]
MVETGMGQTSYFNVKVDEHYECCQLTTVEDGIFTNCEILVASCHPGNSVPLRTKRAIAKHINDEFGAFNLEPGYWRFTKKGPVRRKIASEGESCEAKRDSIMAKFRAPPLPLEERLTKALVVGDRSEQEQELKKIAILAKALPCPRKYREDLEDEGYDSGNERHVHNEHDDDDEHQDVDRHALAQNGIIRRNALFALHGTKFEDEIRKGIKKLETTTFEQQVPMISALVDYRAGKHDILDQIYLGRDKGVAHSSKETRWELRLSAAFARRVAQRAPMFKDATREILVRDLRQFGRLVANRLGKLDLSKIPPCVPVVSPLFDLAWAVREEFSSICKKLKLKRLAKIGVKDLSQIYDDAARLWLQESLIWETKTDDEKAIAVRQVEQRSRILLRDWRYSARAVSEPEELGAASTYDGINNSAQVSEPATSARCVVPPSISTDRGNWGEGTDSQTCPTPPSLAHTRYYTDDGGESSGDGGREFISPRRLLPTARPESSQISQHLPASPHAATSPPTGQKRPRSSNDVGAPENHSHGAGPITVGAPNLEIQPSNVRIRREPTQDADDIPAETGISMLDLLNSSGSDDFNFNF